MRPGKPLLVLVVVLCAMFAALQVVRPERTNPPVDPSSRIDAHVAVPPDVAAIFERSCREGRDEMNLSEWGDYDPETADEILEDICEMVTDGEMPLRPYTWLHPEAKLSSGDVERLCEWSRQSRAALKASEVSHDGTGGSRQRVSD